MTEFWKSNAMHWCDICKCWMNDTKAARLNHERGSQHQAKLATKLRDMARKADDEVRAKEVNDIAMSKIEAAAKKQYKEDRKAAEEAAGSWTWDTDSTYYYNARHRWYYDPKTQWYYGGEPTPEWSQSPPIPAAAMFGVAPHEGGPVPQGQAAAAAGAPGSAAAGAASGSSSRPEGLPVETKIIKRVIAVPKHPLADIGGHQAPIEGRVGGSMGAGVVLEGSGGDAKRKREEQSKGAAGGKKGGAKAAVSAEEAEALARREAAKQRVAQRTAAGFGYL